MTYFLEPPDRERRELVVEMEGIQRRQIIVINSDAGWCQGCDDTDKKLTTDRLGESDLREAKEDFYILRLTYLPSALLDESLNVSILGEVEFARHKTVGLRVSHPRFHDLNFYYDKNSGVLLKREAYERQGLLGRRSVVQTFYSEHKEVQGAKIPFKTTSEMAGEEFLRTKMIEVKLREKGLEASLFKKP